MKSKEQWIEETLNSLDGIQQAIPGITFQEKLLARTEFAHKTGNKVVPLWIWKVAATVLVLISLNFVTGLMVSSGDETYGKTDLNTESVLDYLTPSEL